MNELTIIFRNAAIMISLTLIFGMVWFIILKAFYNRFIEESNSKK